MPLDKARVKVWTDRKAAPKPSVNQADFVRAIVGALGDYHDRLLDGELQPAAERLRWLEASMILDQRGRQQENDYKRTGEKKHRPKPYTPGSIVMVDLGVGVHVEPSYPHPCLVLFNGFYHFVGVPMTHTNRPDSMTVVYRVKGDASDSYIKTNQILTLSKQRVIGYMDSIAGTPDFQKVLNLVLLNYLPDQYTEVATLRAAAATQQTRLTQLERELVMRETTVKELEQQYEELTNVLVSIHQTLESQQQLDAGSFEEMVTAVKQAISAAAPGGKGIDS